MLFVQTDGGLGAVLRFVKQPKKLPVIFPIPSGIVHVNEAFVLNLARDFVQGRKGVSLSANAAHEYA